MTKIVFCRSLRTHNILRVLTTAFNLEQKTGRKSANIQFNSASNHCFVLSNGAKYSAQMNISMSADTYREQPFQNLQCSKLIPFAKANRRMKSLWLATFAVVLQLLTLTNGACLVYPRNPVGISDELKLTVTFVSDSQISSSTDNGTNLATFGRLHHDDAWCAEMNDSDRYLEIDLGIDYKICAVEVQGLAGDTSTVTNFTLSYKASGEMDFTDSSKTFIGISTDGSVVESHELDSPITAQVVRFKPENKNMCMRVEMYGLPTGVDVVCERYRMGISINRTIHHNLNETDLNLLDPSCKAYKKDDLIKLDAFLGLCNSQLIFSNDRETSFYMNQVLTNSTGDVVFNIICAYQIDPVMVTGAASLQFSIAVYEFNNYTSPLQSNIVPLRSTLYFQVEVDSFANTIVLHLERCWATPTSDRNDAAQLELIADGDPKDSYVNYTCNNSSHIQQFELLVFRFVGQTNGDKVYIHCDVRACLGESETSACRLNCNDGFDKRRRRSLEEKIEGNFEIQSLDIGPFIIVDDKYSDHDDNKYDDNEDGGNRKENGQEEQVESLPNYIIIIAVVSGVIIVAIVIVIFAFLVKKPVLNGPTVKDITSDLAIDNLAFNDVEIKTVKMTPK